MHFQQRFINPLFSFQSSLPETSRELPAPTLDVGKVNNASDSVKVKQQNFGKLLDVNSSVDPNLVRWVRVWSNCVCFCVFTMCGDDVAAEWMKTIVTASYNPKLKSNIS